MGEKVISPQVSSANKLRGCGVVAAAPPLAVEKANTFFDLFPHRFDYIYAPHPEPNVSPDWHTESRHPLTDRLLRQGSYLYGVRFGTKTQYCLLDIDQGSPYHPSVDPFAIQRILATLETIGLVSYLACTSSNSGGLHLYIPLQSPQSSWELGAAITIVLENAGFIVKPGCLEVFPNRKCYSVQGKPSLFNAHRLPLQMGSYLLNRDFEPIWSDRHRFVQQWQIVQQQNEIPSGLLRQLLKQNQRKHYQVSGKAAKFINDLNAEIELGWTDHGQTNYLLGRITMRAYIFHHILEGGSPLEGQALVDEIVTIAQSLPGYQEWCQHQHEIEHRAAEWARCIEGSRYFHYGDLRSQKQKSLELATEPKGLNWNQQQSQSTRDRIRKAVADLLDQDALPAQATARFKLLTGYGIGGGSLYRHKDLWHPDFLYLNSEDLANSTDLDICPEPTDSLHYLTSLFPTVGGNAACTQDCSDSQEVIPQPIGGNALSNAGFHVSNPNTAFDQIDKVPQLNHDRSQPISSALQFDQLFYSKRIFRPP